MTLENGGFLLGGFGGGGAGATVEELRNARVLVTS